MAYNKYVYAIANKNINENKTMERELIRNTVYAKSFGEAQPKWKDIKGLFELQDEDLVSIIYDHNDDDWFFVIERIELESDEVYNLRLAREVSFNERQKQKRYERYLELKKEFEIVNEQ